VYLNSTTLIDPHDLERRVDTTELARALSTSATPT
jgi:hypothetical protein